ncbi:MAG: FeoB-associated Cys-rich membrane protein [Butyrivibrio sp.]|nr:FeoB-associated Cys-rich membrane protein [Butyrivibrio sp.]MBQ9589991.1 FeoB-associated Cys-rich membrane protein [Butyrivibrio sp.]
MPPVIGNLIAIAIVIAILYICGKNVVNMIKGELTGKGCSGCSGSCSGSCSGCSSCSSHADAGKGN